MFIENPSFTSKMNDCMMKRDSAAGAYVLSVSVHAADDVED